MRLNDPLVTSFKYKEQEYAIDLSFNNVLDVFDYLEDDNLREYEKAEFCLVLLLEMSFEGMEAVELWNYVYEEFIHVKVEQAIEYDLKGNPLPVQPDEEQGKMIDLEQDAQYIYASFKQAYGMNLYQEQGKLHWNEFQALLNGLPSNTIMKRIIDIRAWKPSKGDSGEYRKNMEDLQRRFALDDREEVE